jgi:hypothetical protein
MTRHDSEYINISHVGSEYINITFFLLLSPHHYVRVDKTNESIYKHIGKRSRLINISRTVLCTVHYRTPKSEVINISHFE